MPKEVIHSQEVPDIHAVVTWVRDQYVQVATEKKGATVCPENPGTDAGGFYFTPTRSEINRLIRVLRRARDQAFGADA